MTLRLIAGTALADDLSLTSMPQGSPAGMQLQEVRHLSGLLGYLNSHAHTTPPRSPTHTHVLKNKFKKAKVSTGEQSLVYLSVTFLLEGR